MQWSDEGIVLSVRPHGETTTIVELLTREHGRHLGLVHGGRSRRMRPTLQIGNHVDADWKGRLSEHLGQFKIELRRGYAADAMSDPASLAALSSMATLSRLLAERETHPNIFEITLFVLGFLDDDSVWPALLVRWELALLEELGFGLELGACAVTGENDALIYVSPKTGRAVSASAGEDYRDRLLHLPQFLRPGRQGGVSADDIDAGFRLTGHFLDRRVYMSRDEPVPEVRARMIELLRRKTVELQS
ncbi:MAG: DNA repair protein RecO [Hyphomicrobiaceae bacterium]